jgi:hypothetical protein
MVVIGSVARAAEPDPQSVVRVFTPAGQPAAGARVWVYEYTATVEGVPEPKPLVADAAGRVTVSHSKLGMVALFARDSDARISSGWVSLPWMDPELMTETKLVLVETTERVGRITDPDGKPVVGATVMPTSYAGGAPTRGKSLARPRSIELPPWEMKRLAATSDSDGRFKLITPRTGYATNLKLKAPGRADSWWQAPLGTDLDIQLAPAATVTVTASGIDPVRLKGEAISLTFVGKETPRAGVHQMRWFGDKFDAEGKATIRDVVPGKYRLNMYADPNMPRVFEPGEPFEVVAGKDPPVAAKFSPAARVTGRIIDKVSGKGVAGVPVFINVMDGQDTNPRTQLNVQTDKEGRFAAHGPAGWYRCWIQNAPEGFSPPANEGRAAQESIKVEAGKSHEFPPYALLRTVTFTGRVVTADGKPAAGAKVRSGGFELRTIRRNSTTADKDGGFSFTNLSPQDAVAPRARLGKAVNIPQTFELEKTKGPVQLELNEENGASFKGRVHDSLGKPVAGATVHLRLMLPGVGLTAGYSTTLPVESAVTDAEGRYTFTGYWPRDQYSASAQAEGYTDGETKQLTGEAGTVQEFPALRLVRTGLAVRGTVVDRDGKPVSGAEVFSVDGPERISAKSALDGTFTLTGFYERPGFVLASKDGFRLAAVPVRPTAPDRVTIRLLEAEAPPVPVEVPAGYRAALDKFTRHALTLVWEAHPTFGYGGNVLTDMARIDVALARKWRDEEKSRTGGKTDFTRRIESVQQEQTLFATAREDIDEAVGVIAGLDARDGFRAATEVAEQMLPVDKAKARRLAEEAVQKARRYELPSRVWALAEAGDLAARAGSAGGPKVIAEAAELAAKLAADERSLNSLAIGLCAAHLAPYDEKKADALLNALTSADDFNRFLSAMAARVARTDLDRAKKLLGRFKPGRTFYAAEARLRVAFAIATAKPDEALALVNGVTEQHFRARGLIQLAVLFAPTDKPRAVKTIDAVFELFDREAEQFRSWSNFGGAAALAALATVRAKDIGHPDVAALVARTLALRSPGVDAWSPNNRLNQTVNLAAVLALVDPVTARHLLAGVAPLEAYAERALAQSRDWLFALALADPERAVGLADKLIARAKTEREGRNALSNTGLVELGSILTARDVLRELTRFGQLPREIEGD